ncbi:MAG TPA: hypothetical protein VFS39_18370 [Nitrospira sp.]|nr:hypothetical protein [Nitrospira sp.]
MIKALIIPVVGPVTMMPLDLQAAALGGRPTSRRVVPTFRAAIAVFTTADPRSRDIKINELASLFVVDLVARGTALITGVQGADVPEDFIEYLEEERLIGPPLPN